MGRDAKGFRPMMEIGLPVHIFAWNFTYPRSFMCSKRCDSIFLDSAPSSGKTKRLKSMRYSDGYIDLSWCVIADDSVTQRSLCPALTLTERVRILVGYYFFHNFLELEFYIFRNNDQTHTFQYFPSNCYTKKYMSWKDRECNRVQS